MSGESDDGDESVSALLPISETTDLCHITYSRQKTIEVVKGHFQFLTKMYLDPDQITTPPNDGWPEITSQTMKNLGKTDEVIALLRQLPYIRKSTDGTVTHAAGACVFADWPHHAQQIASSPQAASNALLLTQSPWTNIPPT